MPDLIFVKIMVNKINKARMFKGKQHTYLDCTLMPNKNGRDEYGNDYFIVQSVTKEERTRGIKGDIIGNAKIHERQESAPAKRAETKPRDTRSSQEPESDDVPF